ncbi:MAG: hypothetical protein MJB14_13530 [Spirochaetes bacterium]|nr:hypothetical protein [Spirochaetota bacterium]
MEQFIKLNESYDSLEKIQNLVKQKTSHECSIEYNIWEVATGPQVEKCVLVKKNNLIGLKMDLQEQGMVKMMPVVPSKYLIGFTVGRGIFPPLVRAMLSGSQKSFMDEISTTINKDGK